MTVASTHTTSSRVAVASADNAVVCCSAVGSIAFDEADAAELARGFAALSDPVRLHLLSLITSTGEQGACVCDLVEPVGRSQPTVSHHLKVLREAGLVSTEKRGTWVWYRADHAAAQRLQRALG